VSGWREAIRLLATPLGRWQLASRIFAAGWPVLRRLARLYRTTLISRTRVAAVIGSVGKTTCTRLIWRVLDEPGPEPRGRNASSFIARALFWIRPGWQWAVIEVGIRGFGRMETYADTIRPDVVVVTAIASDHKRTFETLEATGDEKAKMVAALSPSGVAILNGDDPHVLRMARSTAARTVTYGFGPDNDVRALSYRADGPARSVLEVAAAGQRQTASVRLVGRHSAYAVLAAVAVGLEAGRDLRTILDSLADIEPTEGRMQPLPLPGGAWLVRDEYKGSVETVLAALDALREIPAERRIVVLGEVSDVPGPHRQVYREVGERLAGVADRAILVCSTSGFKAYRAGGRSVLPGFDPLHVRDWRTALAALDPGPGDVILVKSRASQRLARLSLALLDHDVTCAITLCRSSFSDCAHCPALSAPGPAPGRVGPAGPDDKAAADP
jgi:UDP-N-acetylmuramoyl-tripeptide--D-alanyl-D-alanine ligase